MKLLLDTHVLLWYLAGSQELKASHLALIDDPSTTFWSVKQACGKSASKPVLEN